MKTLKTVLLFLAGMVLMSACSKEEMWYETEVAGESPIVVTLPFEGEYTGTILSGATTLTCCDGFSHTLIDGSGTASCLGNSTMHFNFCSAGVDHGQECSFIVSSSGDSLYVCSPGEFVSCNLPGQPSYIMSCWRSTFTIRGGTGRYEGASGGGMTDDYISSEDGLSHHHWTGTITLMRGNNY